VILATANVLVVIVAIAVGLVVTAQRARHALEAARVAISAVRADVTAGRYAGADLRTARREADRARRLTHGPLWFVSSWVPPVGAVQGLTDVAAQLTDDVLPPIVRLEPTIEPSKLRVGPHRIALQPLQAAAPALQTVDREMAAIRQHAIDLPGGWFGPINDDETKLVDQLNSVSGSIDDAARFASVGPGMLGAAGKRRYFVGIQNNAEAKATGGLVAAYAILTADNGRLKVVGRGNDGRLKVADHAVRTLAADYYEEYGRGSTRHWTTSNSSPNFPDAAHIWARLWHDQGGRRIDGVIGVDPFALASILAVQGPVTVPGYSMTFTGENLAPFIESGEYAAFRGAQATLRKPFLSKVAGRVLHRLFSGSGSATALVTALGREAGEGHLQMWANDPTDQAGLSGTPLAGELVETAAPFAAATFNDSVGSKLDYYLDRSLTYRAGSCSGSRRDATIDVRMVNQAPRHGLPGYVRIRNDIDPDHPERVPAERLRVRVYASDGAALRSTTFGGHSISAVVGEERGHPVFAYDVTLPPGAPRSLVLHLSEPIPHGTPLTKVQPMARPQHTVLDVPTCH
jgi:hypothetical protein